MTMHPKSFIHNYDAMISKSSLITCTFLVKITFTRKSNFRKSFFKSNGSWTVNSANQSFETVVKAKNHPNLLNRLWFNITTG